MIDVAVLKFNATGSVGEHLFLARLGLELGIPMRIEDFFDMKLTSLPQGAVRTEARLGTAR